MEGRLVPEDDLSSPDVLRILRQLQSVGFCSNLEHNPTGFSFEHILSVFLKEIHCKTKIPPFPAMLGDGRPVGLYKLYRLVSDSGGYDSVTAKNSWASVAEGMGLSSVFGCPLKLVYAKYLNTLGLCLQRIPVNKSGNGGYSGCQENLGILMSDSESEARSLFKEILKQKKTDCVDSTLSPCSKRVHLLTPARKKEHMLLFDNAERDKTNGSTTLHSKLPNGSFSSLKRKRDMLVGMLNWLKSLAKNPIDPSTGKILPSDGLQVGNNMIGEQYSLVLQARKALFLKKIRNDLNFASTLQSKQKVHPTIYNCNGAPNLSFQTLRTHSSDNPAYSGSCSKPSMVCIGREKDVDPVDSTNEVNHCRRVLRSNASLPVFLDECVPIRIPVGSSFQAKVLPWTRKDPVVSYDSNDLKWLGKRIWPPENHEELPTEPNLIGKGREDYCNCSNSGSVECVRFHVAEERLQLKCKLGAAFYEWRFNFMGEEVALSWKEEEERLFKATFRLNQHAVSKNFWKQLRSCLPNKGHTSLVNYYFNVFLLALRSYQNRVSPNKIDSDDEESGFGFLSCTFGYGAVRFHDPRPITCAQNLQCIDIAD